MARGAIAGCPPRIQGEKRCRRNEYFMTRHGDRVARAAIILCVLTHAQTAWPWGSEGHEIVTRAALAAGDGLPPWFLAATPALVDLSNAPDRWRELDEALPALAAR